jgi:hypothetical protein
VKVEPDAKLNELAINKFMLVIALVERHKPTVDPTYWSALFALDKKVLYVVVLL